MKRKVINKKSQNIFLDGGLASGINTTSLPAKTLNKLPTDNLPSNQGLDTLEGGVSSFSWNPYVSMAMGFDLIAQGGSKFLREEFGGDSYLENPNFINEGIFGDSSGMNISRMWTMDTNLDKAINKVEDYGNQGFLSQSLEGLLNEYQNTNFLKESNISGSALDKSDITDFLFDPLSYSLTSLFGKRKSAREREEEINNAIREANARKMASLNNSIQQVQNRNKMQAMQTMYAFGGPFDSYIGGAIDYDLAQKNLENKRIDALSKNKITALPATGSVESINMFASGGGLSRSKDYGSKKKPYPSVKKGDFAGGGRSYPIPTKADAVDALRLAGLHNRPDVKAKVYKKYPSLKKHAFGGDLNSNGLMFDLGYTNIGNGNTHENNIYGGVPVSIDALGIPNLVEEGEVIWNDYVFSNRLKNPKTGHTFAKDAKKAQQESKERPNDPISKRGLEAVYTKLANIQEGVREKEGVNKENIYAKGSKMDVNWSTYNPNPWYDTMRQSTIIPGIVGLLNPPEAYNYKVPKSREVDYIPLGDLMQYTPFDTDYRTSLLQAEAAATRRALRNSANPMSDAAILAADYNSQLALGNLARQAAEYNLAQKQAVAQFNRGTRQANQEAALNAAMANQKRDLQQVDLETAAERYYQDQLDKVYATKMGNLSNIFDNLGKIGQDYRNSYDARWAARYLPGGYTIKYTNS